MRKLDWRALLATTLMVALLAFWGHLALDARQSSSLHSQEGALSATSTGEPAADCPVPDVGGVKPISCSEAHQLFPRDGSTPSASRPDSPRPLSVFDSTQS